MKSVRRRSIQGLHTEQAIGRHSEFSTGPRIRVVLRPIERNNQVVAVVAAEKINADNRTVAAAGSGDSQVAGRSRERKRPQTEHESAGR